MRLDRTTLALLTVQLLFAVHYVGTKFLLASIPAPAWVALRVGSAALLLLVLTHRHWRRYPRDARLLRRLAILSLFGVVLNQVLFIEGLSRTLPSHSSLINTSIPVSTLLIAVVLRHERGTRRKGLAVALSLSGVLLLLLGTADLGASRATVLGDLLCLTNATSFSLFLVLSRPVMKTLSPMVTTPLIFAFGAVGTTIYGAPHLVALNWSEVPASMWWLGAGLVAGPTVGAYFLNYWALQRVESSRVALFIYLQFLVATPLSAWLLDERLSWLLVPSAALVFTGVALGTQRPLRRRGRRAAEASALAPPPEPGPGADAGHGGAAPPVHS